MSNAVAASAWITPEEYLAMEERAEAKHEYAGGHIYAMSGATNAHNKISGNIFLRLGLQLLGKPCQLFNSDTKLRLRIGGDIRFYYPDVMVVCRENPDSDVYQDEPVVVFEVVSPSSQRIDFDSKQLAYRSLESLHVYAVVSSEEAGMTVFRRAGTEWQTEIIRNPGGALELPTIGCRLPLTEIYQNVRIVRSSAE